VLNVIHSSPLTCICYTLVVLLCNILVCFSVLSYFQVLMEIQSISLTLSLKII
jgi:hypothetical protein